MLISLKVVAQVHHLARQAKVKKTLTFTNTHNEHDGNDVDVVHANDKLAGVNVEDEETASNEN